MVENMPCMYEMLVETMYACEKMDDNNNQCIFERDNKTLNLSDIDGKAIVFPEFNHTRCIYHTRFFFLILLLSHQKITFIFCLFYLHTLFCKDKMNKTRIHMHTYIHA